MTYREQLETFGGFTIDSPSTGYMVSLRGCTRVIPFTEFTDDDVADYIDAMGGLPARVHVGGWLDGDQVYLDLSEHVTSRGWAMRLGINRNQIAIWDIENGSEISTGGNGE